MEPAKPIASLASTPTWPPTAASPANSNAPSASPFSDARLASPTTTFSMVPAWVAVRLEMEVAVSQDVLSTTSLKPLLTPILNLSLALRSVPSSTQVVVLDIISALPVWSAVQSTTTLRMLQEDASSVLMDATTALVPRSAFPAIQATSSLRVYVWSSAPWHWLITSKEHVLVLALMEPI